MISKGNCTSKNAIGKKIKTAKFFKDQSLQQQLFAIIIQIKGFRKKLPALSYCNFHKKKNFIRVDGKECLK